MTYTVYNFGELRVLVRCRIHGYLNETQASDTSPTSTLPPPSPSLLPSDAHRRRRYVGTKAKLDYRYDEDGT